ncbi:MAG: hypothetical protein V3V41_01360 [Candidatus Heimdallarchaeota archaeon]
MNIKEILVDNIEQNISIEQLCLIKAYLEESKTGYFRIWTFQK